MTIKKIIALLVAILLSTFTFVFAQSADGGIDTTSTDEWVTVTAWEEDPFADVSEWEEDPFVDVSEWEEDPFATDDDLFGEDIFAEDPVENSWTSEWETLTWWGFKDTDVVNVVAQTDNGVTLSVPKVIDGVGSDVLRYQVVYSTKSITDPSYDWSQMQQQEFNFELITGDTVELQVENLSAWVTYYWVVVPRNKDSVDWVTTQEFVFQSSWTTEVHGVAPVDIANISYTYEDKKINLKWTSTSGADQVEVYVRSDIEKDFKKMWVASMIDWTFSFLVSETWNYIVKLIPTDINWAPVWQEKLQPVKIEVTDQPEVTTPPTVWPATNIMLAILLVSLLWYVLIRYKRIDK